MECLVRHHRLPAHILALEDGGGNLSVAHGNLAAVLLEAIKELQLEIEALRERVTALEAARAVQR